MKLTEIILAAGITLTSIMPIFDGIPFLDNLIPRAGAQESEKPKKDDMDGVKKGLSKAAEAFAKLDFIEISKKFDRARLETELSEEYQQWVKDKKSSKEELEKRAEFFKQHPDFETEDTYEVLESMHSYSIFINAQKSLIDEIIKKDKSITFKKYHAKEIPIRTRLYQNRVEELKDPKQQSLEFKSRKEKLLDDFIDNYEIHKARIERCKFLYVIRQNSSLPGLADEIKKELDFYQRIYDRYIATGIIA